MFKINVRDYEKNKVLKSYSFDTKREARREISKVCELHDLKKCGYDYMNYNLSLELEILF